VALAAIVGLGLAAACAAVLVHAGFAPVEWGAAAILHPVRRPLTRHPSRAYETVAFTSERARLEGWLFRAAGERRGLVVYLHGIADNRQSGLGVVGRLVPEGYDVFAFDARAHGRSTGEACTYGYYERLDVGRALDALEAPRAILLGHSLGAAIALQAAAVDPRVTGVVAASSFSDLPTIVRERSRWFWLPNPYVEAALERAGEEGRFPPAEASPVALAPRIVAPVLLLHGGDDFKTPADHSRRIAAALRCPHRLVVLPGVGHDEILGREEAWREIEPFLAEVARGPASERSRRPGGGGPGQDAAGPSHRSHPGHAIPQADTSWSPATARSPGGHVTMRPCPCPMPRPLAGRWVDALFEAFEEARRAGKVSHLGVSGHCGGMQASLNAAIDRGRGVEGLRVRARRGRRRP
jgi:pimeloyl-ACP methyl ester carboxylesterase